MKDPRHSTLGRNPSQVSSHEIGDFRKFSYQFKMSSKQEKVCDIAGYGVSCVASEKRANFLGEDIDPFTTYV